MGRSGLKATKEDIARVLEIPEAREILEGNDDLKDLFEMLQGMNPVGFKMTLALVRKQLR